MSLTPLYHLHLFHRLLDINQAISTDSPPLHIASRRTRLVFERKLLTTKLRVLNPL